MISCKEESSKPTVPSIPVGPDWQTSENSNEMGFYSGKGDGQFGAFVNENSEFQISVPAGDFLLTYVTTAGTYYVAFRATKAAVLHIGMHDNVTVVEASVQKGHITDESGDTWPSNDVTLFAWPGSDARWKDVFKSDKSSVIVLIAERQVAGDVEVLPEPQTGMPTTPTVAPNPSSTAKRLIVAQVTDPNTAIGIIATDGGRHEAIAFLGAKDNEGNLTSLQSVVLTSLTDDRWAQLTLDSQNMPKTMTYSDGTRAEFSNYIGGKVDITLYSANGTTLGTSTQPLNLDPSIFTNGTNLKSGWFKKNKKWVDFGFKVLSAYGCASATAAAFASGGAAIPLAIWSCGSLLVDIGLDVATEANPQNKDLCEFKRYFNSVSNFGGCLIEFKPWACTQSIASQGWSMVTDEDCENPEAEVTPTQYWYQDCIETEISGNGGTPYCEVISTLSKCSETLDIQICDNVAYSTGNGCRIIENVLPYSPVFSIAGASCRFSSNPRVLGRKTGSNIQFPIYP